MLQIRTYTFKESLDFHAHKHAAREDRLVSSEDVSDLHFRVFMKDPCFVMKPDGSK